ELVGKAGGRKAVHKKNVLMDNAARAGYAFSVLVIILALISGIPFFTRYFSPVTGFFRVITGGVFAAIGLPVESGLLLFSAGLLALLIILDLFYPRLWCRVLCPIGKTYGLFNKVSFLRLSIYRNECGECNLCEQKCYMGVKIARYVDQADLRDGECIFCGRCVEGCRTKGKLLHLKFRRPS
ncbi:MAG TPA: 4Fe-4S dicluster domain-containing protein, partial [Thermodesulfobacteriota bacterium]|nr:4Fe-4S dicluster domain-containing protein [Thermodesulfobacteriota bacterium]